MERIKTIFKIVLSVIIVVAALGTFAYYAMNAENIPFETVCEKGHPRYNDLCGNVGKRARTIKNMAAIRDVDYGEIIGVAWRQRGSIISSPGQVIRFSESNSYYYIVRSDQKGYYFLRLTSEVDAR
jgi:hypothetical protein